MQTPTIGSAEWVLRGCEENFEAASASISRAEKGTEKESLAQPKTLLRRAGMELLVHDQDADWLSN